MRGDQLNSALGTQHQEPKNTDTGLSMGDILTLPDRQRRIVNWISRHQECTPPEVAEHLGEDEPTAKNELDALVQQGFVQETLVAGESRYSIKRATKRRSQLSDKLYQALTPEKPLIMSLNPEGDVSVPVGSTFELGITVENNGNQSARIDIYIDKVSGILREWCVSPHERIALGAGQKSELVFQIRVPVEAVPGTYDYTFVVDAQQHYPEDTPLRHQARLQVIDPDLNQDE